MLRRRPSPSMVVATIALFIAMSGTTYAVTKLPKNSVGSSQLRANAVATTDIKDGAVTSSKLAQGLLPGQSASAPASASDRVAFADRAGFASRSDTADRATFADSAGRATTAASADSSSSAGTANNANLLDGKDSSAFLPRGLIVDVPRFSLNDGQQREILRLGPFTVTARCDIDEAGATGPVDSADMLLSSSQNNAVMDGFTINSDLDPGDLEVDRVLIAVAPPAGTSEFESSADGTFAAPDGTEVRSAVLQTGVNIFGQSNKCFFGGYFLI